MWVIKFRGILILSKATLQCKINPFLLRPHIPSSSKGSIYFVISMNTTDFRHITATYLGSGKCHNIRGRRIRQCILLRELNEWTQIILHYIKGYGIQNVITRQEIIISFLLYQNWNNLIHYVNKVWILIENLTALFIQFTVL